MTNKDKAWILENHSGLKIADQDNPVSIKGTLALDMFYDKENKRFFLNPKEDYDPQEYRIRDEYQIEIILENTKFSDLPRVREIGGRIERVRKVKGFAHPKDMHVSENGNVCLCPKQAEFRILSNGFNMKDFVSELVTPFFYGQSFYARNGSWPFGEYQHGTLGLLEYYRNVRRGFDKKLIEDTVNSLKLYNNFWEISFRPFLQMDDVSWNGFCPCESKKKFQECHPEIFWILWLLKQDIKKADFKLR